MREIANRHRAENATEKGDRERQEIGDRR